MAMRTIRIFLVIFFVVFINSAAIQYFYPVVKVERVNESREKMAWPRENPWVGLSDGVSYAATVERFFSDNFPLRDFVLRSLGQFEYSVLGRSREVIVGKEGWLSDKKVMAEQLHQLDRVSDEQIQASVTQIKRLQHWLAGQGCDFLMVIVPMKPTIYAEKFPEKYVRRPAQTGLQRFQNALEHNGIPFVDALNILNKHKSEVPLFYKTDMHWNTAGISYVAEAMVNHFSYNAFGKPLWNERTVKSIKDFSGGELTTMPLLFPESEMAPSWISGNPGYTERVDNDGETPVRVFTGTDKARALLPPSIMFGNSFMLQYPAVGYHNYFAESTRVLDYQYFSKVMDYIKPEHKIFILHIYETQLLFHVLPMSNNRYWDSRINNLPLPPSFRYTESSSFEGKAQQLDSARSLQ